MRCFYMIKIKIQVSLVFCCFTGKKDIKCLLCSSRFKDQKELLDYYLSYHNIDEDNCFFQKLVQAKNKSLLTNCVRCHEFLTTEKHKTVYDFLRHYNGYKSIPFEEKPLDILRHPALTIYYIEFQKHGDFYNFYNSDKYVDFLKNVKYRFKLKYRYKLSNKK